MENYKKKYEHALDNFKKIKAANKDNKELVDFIEYEYPELKENKDDRIREAIYNCVKWFGFDSCFFKDVSQEECFAWLEKQGEQKFPSLSEKEIVCLKRILDFLREEHNSYTGKDFTNEIAVLEWLITHPVLIHFSELQQTQGWQKPVVITPKFHKGDIIKPKGSSHTHWEIMQVDMFDKKYRFKNGCVIHFSQEDDYELVEQKSTDKVEPKFKVGDWVIDKHGIVHQISNVIENVTNHTYGYDTVDGKYFNDNTEGVRLWTIQDAKDGDVLATDNNSICIFDGTVEDGIYPFAYCGLIRRQGFDVYDRKLPFTHDKDIRPATKEQRDLLFAKMKEAGYEWDSEKKELKKIEQNPAWSEEDEKMLNHTISTVELHLNDIGSDRKEILLVKEEIDWLKSIKERMKGE